jgi:hypothetical protein
MKFIKTCALLLCFLSPFVQAETTFLGLTLGKSTFKEVEQTHTFKWKTTQSGLPNTWNTYRVTGEQFEYPTLKFANLHFDNTHTLGRMVFVFPSSLDTYKKLYTQMSKLYPKETSPFLVADQLHINRADFENDTTHVEIIHNNYFTEINLIDLKYHTATHKYIAEMDAREANKPTKDAQ